MLRSRRRNAQHWHLHRAWRLPRVLQRPLCVVFMYERLSVSPKERAVSALVILLGIVTCGSTTGLISLLAMLAFYFILPSGACADEKSRRRVVSSNIWFSWCRWVLWRWCATTTCAATQSILVESVFSKLFSSEGPSA